MTKKYAPPIESLRNWSKDQVKNSQFCSILGNLVQNLEQEISKESDLGLSELLLNFKEIDQSKFSILMERIKREAWGELIGDIYQILSLIETLTHFKDSKELLPSNFEASITGPEDFERDLRGIECPRNYAKAKVALSKLPSGAHLTILLDSGMPIENVPMRLKADGYHILKRVKLEGYWSITVSTRNESIEHV